MPDTQSSALTPSPDTPATAVAASAPLPSDGSRVRSMAHRRKGFVGLVDAALDGLDALADRIAGVAQLR